MIFSFYGTLNLKFEKVKEMLEKKFKKKLILSTENYLRLKIVIPG